MSAFNRERKRAQRDGIKQAAARNRVSMGTATVTVGDERITGVRYVAYDVPAYRSELVRWGMTLPEQGPHEVIAPGGEHIRDEAWSECTRNATPPQARYHAWCARGMTLPPPPAHGPMHRDAKHVARLVHAHHARAMARLVARPADAVHEPAATSGTVHEEVVVTG